MPIAIKLLLGFLAVTVVTGVLGLHAYLTIASIGTIAMDTYDKPLMAINFARASETGFIKLSARLNEVDDLGNDQQSDEDLAEEIVSGLEDLVDNLDVVTERALTEETRTVAAGLLEKAELWLEQAEEEELDPVTLTDAAEEIAAALEGLVESTAAEGFEFRLVAEEEVERQGLIMIAAVACSLVFALIVALVLGRVIVTPLKRVISALQALCGGDLSVKIEAKSNDEVGALARVVMSYKETRIEMDAMQREQTTLKLQAEGSKRRAMSQLADDIEGTVKSVVEVICASADELRATASEMAGRADRTRQGADMVSNASEQAAGNVQTVAAATEELSCSVSEIERHVSQSSSIADCAVNRVKETNETIEGLSTAAVEIGDVIQLISDIAEQTNLLALNATIEAARAGEAGKGFSVVANEVKNLAKQTASATEQIAEKVEHIRAVTGRTVTAIGGIGETISEVNELSSTIAATIDQQNSATREIAGNVAQAAGSTTEVSSNISQVAETAKQTGTAANQVLDAAEQLSGEANALIEKVESFLNEIRGDLSERRREDRHVVDFQAELESGGDQRHDCRVKEISSWGVRLETDVDLAQHDQVLLAFDQVGEVTAKVIWREANTCGLQFAEPFQDMERILEPAGSLQPAA